MSEVLLVIDFKNLPQVFENHLKVLGPIDHFTLAVNLLILVFSKSFATQYGEIKNNNKSQARLRILNSTNLILFLIYLIAVIFEIRLGKAISQTFLVILGSYLIFILQRHSSLKGMVRVKAWIIFPSPQKHRPQEHWNSLFPSLL